MNFVSKPESGGVPFEITQPDRIPAQRYYDKEFYELENERLWPHVWQLACRLEQPSHSPPPRMFLAWVQPRRR